jgi:hypothetical protein
MVLPSVRREFKSWKKSEKRPFGRFGGIVAVDATAFARDLEVPVHQSERMNFTPNDFKPQENIRKYRNSWVLEV